jgi:hypothetical protein
VQPVLSDGSVFLRSRQTEKCPPGSPGSRPCFSPGVLEGLEIRLKHGPPFLRAECEAAEHLQVIQDADPKGLELLTAITSITFRGCENVDLNMLRKMNLQDLASWSSNLTDISLLPKIAPELTHFDGPVNQIRDLRPLLELPKLRTGKVAGNPLDEHSFRVVLPELMSRGILKEWVQGGIVVEEEYLLMRRFTDRNLRLSAFTPQEWIRVKAPGHLLTTSPEGGGVELPYDEWNALLDEHPDADERALLDLAKARKREVRRRLRQAKKP